MAPPCATTRRSFRVTDHSGLSLEESRVWGCRWEDAGWTGRGQGQDQHGELRRSALPGLPGVLRGPPASGRMQRLRHKGQVGTPHCLGESH